MKRAETYLGNEFAVLKDDDPDLGDFRTQEETEACALRAIESAQREAWNEAVEAAAMKAGHHAGPGIANTIRTLHREEE